MIREWKLWRGKKKNAKVEQNPKNLQKTKHKYERPTQGEEYRQIIAVFGFRELARDRSRSNTPRKKKLEGSGKGVSHPLDGAGELGWR